MHIHFGLSLDGKRGRSAQNRLGFITAGPLGMLNVLETQMGFRIDRAAAVMALIGHPGAAHPAAPPAIRA